MKRYIALITIISVLVGVGWWHMASNRVDHVAIIDQEVQALSLLLDEMTRQVESGTLTPDMALTMQGRIVTQLDAVATQVKFIGDVTLSRSKQTQLHSALADLYSNLGRSKDALLFVETEAAKEQMRQGGSGKKGTITESLSQVTVVVVDTTESVITEEVVETVELFVTDVVNFFATASTADSILKVLSSTSSAYISDSNAY